MRSFRSVFVTVHYWSFYALLVAIMIHIVGVFVPERFTPNSWTLLLGEVGPTRGGRSDVGKDQTFQPVDRDQIAGPL